jgi:hypothetical protein
VARRPRRARDVRALLEQNLFNPLDTVLARWPGMCWTATTAAPTGAPRRRCRPPRRFSQMRKLLAGNPGFVLGKLVARKIKVWQRKAAA